MKKFESVEKVVKRIDLFYRAWAFRQKELDDLYNEIETTDDEVERSNKTRYYNLLQRDEQTAAMAIANQMRFLDAWKRIKKELERVGISEEQDEHS